MALSLLEALRDQDLPEEILDDENLTITLPRRLGLSGVVDSQIRRYREDARRRRRVPDREVQDLIELVVRRPDARAVFLRVGADLHAGESGPGWRRLLPRAVAHRVAVRRIRQRLRTLFGRPVVAASRSPIRLRAVDDFFVRSDRGGAACAVVTGFARAELDRLGAEALRFAHLECRCLDGDDCVWGLLRDDSEV